MSTPSPASHAPGETPMDEGTARRLAVILGATGTLGSAVTRALAEQGWPLLLVARDATRARSATGSPGASAVAHDVVRHDPEALVAAVARQDVSRLLIIDAILDKRTTRTMRQSLSAATTTAASLGSRLANAGAQVLLIACGSTASIARFPYRTTYGRAKHGQAAAYLRLGLPAAVIHLPTVLGADSGRPARVDRLLWPLADFTVHACTVEQAAAALAALAANPNEAQTGLPVEQRNLLTLRHITRSRTPRWLTTVAAPLVAMLGHSILRNDPAWQRRASYALLHLMPPRLRRSVDHHQRPPFACTSDGCAWLPTTTTRSQR